MNDWIEYEAIIYALGGEVACPECGIGILIPCGEGEAQTLVCDVCDEVFVVADGEE